MPQYIDTSSSEVLQQAASPDEKCFIPSTIPQSTYRLQFNYQFTFKQALELVPYLAKLGITHCYASPILQARPGSLHGYDIINHQKINPEIGTYDDFLKLSQALKHHHMQLILDIVPNHMGIGSDNLWWMDVLENGPASPYSSYFDIDWQPVKDELFGKVLLPILGNQYGEVLENGDLQVEFNPETGVFSLHYFHHRFPINPQSYPIILGCSQQYLARELGTEHPAFQEYLSIQLAFERLPSHMDNQPDRIQERLREKKIAQKRLVFLCQQEKIVHQTISYTIAEFNQLKDNQPNCQFFHELLQLQIYRLADWRVASDEINYRRFFDINELAGICAENYQVFNDTHQFIFELLEQNIVSGLRIDHPDGLYDPKQYFERLQAEAVRRLVPSQANGGLVPEKPLYILAEKILAPYERLPSEWPIHGTSGYDFVNLVSGLFIDKKNADIFTQLYQEFVSDSSLFEEEVYRCKLLIMKNSLASELNVLTYQLNRISESDWSTRDFTLNNLRAALRQIVAYFPVYRTYVTPEAVSKKDRDYIDWAVNLAKKRSVGKETSIYDFIRSILLLETISDSSEEYRKSVIKFSQKFQQFTGPVMAKSLEDTAFYRYNRLIALNEVGGSPDNFGTSLSTFHHQNQERSKSWPHAMLATSTHDTKRSEDTRVRLAVLSEIPEEWNQFLTRWSRMNQFRRKEIEGQWVPSRNEEYLIYQTLLGIFPLEPLTVDSTQILVQRLKEYMLKATREAKINTSWLSPNLPYEEALFHFIDELLNASDSTTFLEDFKPLAKKISYLGMLNSLSQTILKLSCPGVPDVYQGNELLDFSLVDPDNRRAVNYGFRQALVQTLEPLIPQSHAVALPERLASLEEIVQHWQDSRAKLYCLMAVLAVRNQKPLLFSEGSYIPLEVQGACADHVIAFARVYSVEKEDPPLWMIVIVPRFMSGILNDERPLPVGNLIWKDTQVLLPEECTFLNWCDGLTGKSVQLVDRLLAVGEVLTTLPVTILLN